MLQQFCSKLRYLRQQHQLTQDELADHLGLVAQGQLSLLERGLRQPSLDVVLATAARFGTTTDYLLNDALPVEAAAPLAKSGVGETSQLRFFGTKLRVLRRSRQMTQTDLALQLAPYTQAHISQLERGISAPSIELVLDLARCFSVTTDYLLLDAIPVDRVSPSAGGSHLP